MKNTIWKILFLALIPSQGHFTLNSCPLCVSNAREMNTPFFIDSDNKNLDQNLGFTNVSVSETLNALEQNSQTDSNGLHELSDQSKRTNYE